MGSQPAFAVYIRYLDPRRPVVEVHGEIDLATAPQFADGVAAALRSDPTDVILDFTETSFLDSSGISVMIETRNCMHARSRLVIRRPLPFICDVLTMLKLDTIFAIETL